MTADRGLRIFHRDCEPDFVSEIFRDAQTILPRPAEPGRVLRINGHRQSFAAIVYALLGFRNQAPHLSTCEGEPVIEGNLAKGLPLAEGIAVALVVIGGYTGREKIGLHVSGKLRMREFPFHQHRHTGLASRAEELR